MGLGLLGTMAASGVKGVTDDVMARINQQRKESFMALQEQMRRETNSQNNQQQHDFRTEEQGVQNDFTLTRDQTQNAHEMGVAQQQHDFRMGELDYSANRSDAISDKEWGRSPSGYVTQSGASVSNAKLNSMTPGDRGGLLSAAAYAEQHQMQAPKDTMAMRKQVYTEWKDKSLDLNGNLKPGKVPFEQYLNSVLSGEIPTPTGENENAVVESINPKIVENIFSKLLALHPGNGNRDAAKRREYINRLGNGNMVIKEQLLDRLARYEMDMQDKVKEDNSAQKRGYTPVNPLTSLN